MSQHEGRIRPSEIIKIKLKFKIKLKLKLVEYK